MNCKTCDYALWNLRTRTCPECGSLFSPAEFEFAPTSVQFCCPHCNQEYYGTDAKGHLVPPEFECVTCGKHIGMAEMVVLPAEGLREAETAPFIVPWLLRGDIGWLRAWFRTVGWGMGLAPLIGKSLPGEAAPRQAFGFGLSALFLALIISVGPFTFWVAGMSQAGGGIGPILIAGVLVLAGVMVIAALLPAVVILLAHGVLRMLGEGADGMGRTTEAVCYTSGPMLISSIPCLGVYIIPMGWLWWMISAALALKERHQARAWKAVVAVAVPGLLIPGLPIAAIFLSVFMSISTMQTAIAASRLAATNAGTEVASLTMAWRVKALQSSTAGAMHSSEFLDTGFVHSGTFMVTDSILTAWDVPVGSLTLADFTGGITSLTPEQAAAVQEAREALPANAIAHRLGDFVFTYHGIDMTTMPQRLWVVIAWPVRSADAPLAADYSIAVGQVDSEVLDITVGEFAEELAAQNDLRATYGLAPLPMPDLVTHEQPATAGDQ